MTKLEIIQLICLSVILISLLIIFVVNGIKNKWISKMTDCIKATIKEAEEKWPEGHGTDKMNYVLQVVQKKCYELGIPYSMIYKLIKALIEKIIDGYNTIIK